MLIGNKQSRKTMSSPVSNKRKTTDNEKKSVQKIKKFKGDANKQQQQQQHSSSSQRKRALKQERQSHRRHADVVAETKEIWNKLRLKNNSQEEIRRLMTELMSLIRGRMNDIALQHDASRVVQAAVQFGTREERAEVVLELCASGNLAELCKVQYAHFVVLKMIKYCAREEDCVKRMVKALKGSIPKLAVHAVGARVVELLFSTFPSKSTSVLKSEFYGPHFSLFAAGVAVSAHRPTLASNLEKVPEKKEAVLKFVVSILNKGMEKGLFGFVYFQELFAEYVEVASPNEIRAVASGVVDHSIHMLSTRAGTRVVAACASYGTAKDRKRIMKSLKGYTRSSLLHRDAYLAILRLVQVTDDTVSIHKSVLAEILSHEDGEEENQSPLLVIALSDTGSRLYLMLLVADDESRFKYLDPYEREILRPGPTVVEDGVQVPTSKKNPETRRKELLQYLRKGLIDLCAKHADALLRSLPGSRVLREVYAAFRPEELVNAVVDACALEIARIDDAENDDSDEDSPAILFEDPVGHLALKNVLLCEAEMEKGNERIASLADALCSRMLSQLWKMAASNRGAFVLTTLLKVESTREKVTLELSARKKELEKFAKASKTTRAGYDALLQAITKKD